MRARRPLKMWLAQRAVPARRPRDRGLALRGPRARQRLRDARRSGRGRPESSGRSAEQRDGRRSADRRRPGGSAPATARCTWCCPLRLVPQKRVGAGRRGGRSAARARASTRACSASAQGPGRARLEAAARAAGVPLDAPRLGEPTGSRRRRPGSSPCCPRTARDSAMCSSRRPSPASRASPSRTPTASPMPSSPLSAASSRSPAPRTPSRTRCCGTGLVDAPRHRAGRGGSRRTRAAACSRHPSTRQSQGAERDMRILVSAVGQYDNVGDTVLRRGFLDHLRTIAPLRVYVGDKPDDYISGLGLHPDDVAGARFEGVAQRRLQAAASWAAASTPSTPARPRCRRPSPSATSNSPRCWPSTGCAAASRCSSAWACGNRRRGGIPSPRCCGSATWCRGATHAAAASWASARSPPTGRSRSDPPTSCSSTPTRPRPRLAIAFRQGLSHAARDKPSRRVGRHGALASPASWVSSPSSSRRSSATARWRSSWRNGSAARPCSGSTTTTPARRSACAPSTATARIVLSDRLHAVVIAATEGAVPIALSTGPMDKVTRTLEGADIPRTSVPRDLADRDAALAVIRDALARRPAIMAAVSTARTRLDAPHRDPRSACTARARRRGEGLRVMSVAAGHRRHPGVPGRGLTCPRRVARLARQDFADFEVVIVEDGSGDDDGGGRPRPRAALRARARHRAAAERRRGARPPARRSPRHRASTCGSSTPTTPGPTTPSTRSSASPARRAPMSPSRTPSSSTRTAPDGRCRRRARSPSPGPRHSGCCCAARSPGTCGTSCSGAAVMQQASFAPARVQSDLVMVADALSHAGRVRLHRRRSSTSTASGRARSSPRRRSAPSRSRSSTRRCGRMPSASASRHPTTTATSAPATSSSPASRTPFSRRTSPPSATRHLRARRAALGVSDVWLFARRRDARRFALAATAKASVRAHRALLKVAER